MKKKKINNIEELFRKKLNESSYESSDDNLFENIFSSYTQSANKNTSSPTESKNIINLYKHHLQNAHTNASFSEAERTQIFNTVYSALIRRKYFRLFARIASVVLLFTGTYLLYQILHQPDSKTNIHQNNRAHSTLEAQKENRHSTHKNNTHYLSETYYPVNEVKNQYPNITDAQVSNQNQNENNTTSLNNKEHRNPSAPFHRSNHSSSSKNLSLSNQNNSYKQTYPERNIPSSLALSKRKTPQENPTQTKLQNENNQDINQTSHTNLTLSEIQNTDPLPLIPIKSIHPTIPETDADIIKDTTTFSFVWKPKPVYYISLISGSDKDSYTILQKAANDYQNNFSIRPHYYSLALGIGTGIEYQKLFSECNILYSQKQTIADSISLYQYNNGKESIVKEYYNISSKYIRWNLNLGYHFVHFKNFRIAAIAGANFYQNYFNNGSVIQKEYVSDKTMNELIISLSPKTVRVNYHYGIRINYHYRAHAWSIGAMQNIYSTNVINTPNNNTAYYTNFQFKTLSVYFQYSFAIKH